MTGTKSYPLPVGLADLLNGSKVESDRLEFKEGWNPPAVLRTVCAFANDFHNYGGGYIVLGVAQADGQPILPAAGIPAKQLDRIQKELLQYCNLMNQLISRSSVSSRSAPDDLPYPRCPGGQTRPYKVPEDVTAKNNGHCGRWRRIPQTA